MKLKQETFPAVGLTLALSTVLPAFAVAWLGAWSDPERLPLRLNEWVALGYGSVALLLLLAGWSWLARWLEHPGLVTPELIARRSRLVLALTTTALLAYGLGLGILFVGASGLAARMQWLSGEGLALVLALLGTAVLILLPGLVVVLVRLGITVGPRLAGQVVVPMAFRHLPAAGLLIATLCWLPAAAWLALGEVSGATWWFVLGLAGYGLGLLGLSSWYSWVSFRPIKDFLDDAGEPADWRSTQLVPSALDVVGTLVAQMQGLVGRVQALDRRHRESEARLRAFAEASSDWFFETDEHLRFTWISPVLESRAGIETSEVVGRSALELNRSNYLSRESADSHLEDLRARRPYRRFRTEVRTDDGRRMHMEVSGTPHFDGDGRFRGYRGTGSNITEVVEAQERLRRQDAQLAQAQKMEAIGQLTGGVAHDFNNLLTVVIGNLELVRMSDRLEADSAELLEEALAASARGADLVRRLLAFARRQPLQPAPVALPALLQDMERILCRTLGEAISLQCELPADTWPVLVDASQLQNAVLNLALNARDAMQAGGVLTITACNCSVTAATPEVPAGEFVQLRVRDTGSGIDPADLPRVFEPFYSTRQAAGGSGLGLAMVHGFVSQSGGGVTIDSRPGAGTEVCLWLPRAASPAVADAAPAATG